MDFSRLIFTFMGPSKTESAVEINSALDLMTVERRCIAPMSINDTKYRSY